jgi:hypothetical protein
MKKTGIKFRDILFNVFKPDFEVVKEGRILHFVSGSRRFGCKPLLNSLLQSRDEFGEMMEDQS